LSRKPLLAGLNHPNILGIFDIGDSYVVMELVEGSTLRGAQLPLRKVLDIGAQIAEGLAAAHGAGITHRDLKPDNVMVTKDGRVKILDFGLAKVRGPQRGEEESRTAVSDPGAVMGTVGYMSPEQVRAQAVDGRSDIFSLGVLLHELIRGERPFLGDSAAEVMAAIAKTDAPPLPEGTPSGVTRVIDKCLAKQPEERWQSPRDLASQLRWLADGGTSTASQKPVPAARQRPWGWIAAAGFALIALGLAFVHFRESPPEEPLMEFLVQPPEKATSLENPTISPDGHILAFTATVEGKRQLWIRPLDSVPARPLDGTEDADYPFWSPDNRFLGFFAQGKLKKVEASGGVPQTLCDALGFGRGGTWNRDGLIVFGAGNVSPLSKVPSSGGTPTAATTLGDGERSHRWPRFLPDGQHFLYWNHTSDRTQNSVTVASLDDPVQSSQHQLVRGALMPLYADANLLFLREDGTLVAQGFNAGGRGLLGEVTPLGKTIAKRSGIAGRAEYSASVNGVLAYLSGNGGQSRLEWRDRAGQLLSTLGEASNWDSVALSPDGRRVTATGGDGHGNFDLWMHDVARNTSTRFTFDPADDGLPVWSPDSSRIFFGSTRGTGGLYEKDASGATEEKLLLKALPQEQLFPSSFDGRHLLYMVRGQKGIRDLWVLSVDGEPKPVPFLITDFDKRRGRFSPDGRWVAYESTESGRFDIYARGFPETGGKWQVSVAGGAFPRWRRDGREIYYVAPDSKLVAAEVKPSGAALEVGSSKELFSVKLTGSFDYDVTADGNRFLVNSRIEGEVPPITVVLNWPRKLKKP
jgi:Tol biopolymer transport system component